MNKLAMIVKLLYKKGLEHILIFGRNLMLNYKINI